MPVHVPRGPGQGSSRRYSRALLGVRRRHQHCRRVGERCPRARSRSCRASAGRSRACACTGSRSTASGGTCAETTRRARAATRSSCRACRRRGCSVHRRLVYRSAPSTHAGGSAASASAGPACFRSGCRAATAAAVAAPWHSRASGSGDPWSGCAATRCSRSHGERAAANRRLRDCTASGCHAPSVQATGSGRGGASAGTTAAVGCADGGRQGGWRCTSGAQARGTGCTARAEHRSRGSSGHAAGTAPRGAQGTRDGWRRSASSRGCSAGTASGRTGRRRGSRAAHGATDAANSCGSRIIGGDIAVVAHGARSRTGRTTSDQSIPRQRSESEGEAARACSRV